MNPRPNIFCYAPQRRAIQFAMEAALGTRFDHMTSVDDSGIQLKGTTGIFVEMADHPAEVPVQILESLRALGYITWTIDERFVRGRAAREHAALPRPSGYLPIFGSVDKEQ